eukprot:CAMPEP_0206002772 /NCGR_PEP_ID=MMETSP1464-20131121/2968_1 /ASSEMBLY_ACC=CAM_ASM_001124 /TAXON_ID=119497 /ORGANISM="Exanthemachrysis gayraliae, Strain RCC1523" /LENGTH=42 /DNA_ID= /DNA_START= /DNA_END= /DNA_ORIENTATION=
MTLRGGAGEAGVRRRPEFSEAKWSPTAAHAGSSVSFGAGRAP